MLFKTGDLQPIQVIEQSDLNDSEVSEKIQNLKNKLEVSDQDSKADKKEDKKE